MLAVAGLVLALIAIPVALGWLDPVIDLYRSGNWEAIGAIGEGVIGAFGQILVALVALAIAWRQVMVDQRLTTQQNRITQAQTIDNFIHGISQLVSDEEGLLEDWPLERMLAEGRLAAVLSSIDSDGKARIIRFLSHARLLTPLRRDGRLGRAILDGNGSYEEDRLRGLPVIQLKNMLQGIDLSGTDLRGVDFNRADLRGTDLSHADLSGANLAGCNLGGANLEGARLEGVIFFWGRAQTATPLATRPDPGCHHRCRQRRHRGEHQPHRGPLPGSPGPLLPGLLERQPLPPLHSRGVSGGAESAGDKAQTLSRRPGHDWGPRSWENAGRGFPGTGDATRRGGRVVDGSGLENRRGESLRGFESHPLRSISISRRSPSKAHLPQADRTRLAPNPCRASMPWLKGQNDTHSRG